MIIGKIDALMSLVPGAGYVLQGDGTLIWMEGYSIPGLFLTPTIILEIAAPILIIIGYKTRIAASLLFAFCITTALIFHTDFSNQMQITSFLKNIGLAGGFLFIIVNGAKKFSFDNKK